MYFKKFAGRIFGVNFTKSEQAAIDAEIDRQMLENSRRHEIETDSSILWMLHEHFGFGPKRLKNAWEMFYEQARALEKYYEMPDGDGGWLCLKKLENIGCNVAEWYKEMEGNKK